MYTLDEMFEFDFDAPNPSTPIKERIRAFTKKYYEWVKKTPAAKLIRSVKKLSEAKGAECPTCNGTGTYVGKRYTRNCFRCTDGVLAPDDVARNERYDAGGRSVDYTGRESTFGSNRWGFIAA